MLSIMVEKTAFEKTFFWCDPENSQGYPLLSRKQALEKAKAFARPFW
jgi:hypothetical protein